MLNDPHVLNGDPKSIYLCLKYLTIKKKYVKSLALSQTHILTEKSESTTRFYCEKIYTVHGKCPKISYTQVSDKMAFANSLDLDQTAPRSKLFVIPLSISSNKCIKKQNSGQKKKSMEWSVLNFRTFITHFEALLMSTNSIWATTPENVPLDMCA